MVVNTFVSGRFSGGDGSDGRCSSCELFGTGGSE